VSSDRISPSAGLYGTPSQKLIFLIGTAVRTSNPAIILKLSDITHIKKIFLAQYPVIN
jgi:hypothetical protein